MDKIRIVLAENHMIVREGLRSLMESTGNVEVVGEAEDGQIAVRLTQELCPDIVIMDVSMPVMDGIQATRQIKEKVSDVRVIMLTMHSGEMYVQQALQAGASGYLVKDTAAQILMEAVQAVMDGEMYLSPEISKIVIEKYAKMVSEAPSKAEGLTGREQEILKLVAEGRTNREVGELLDLAEKTVATHRANFMRKLNLHNISELVRYAIREGLIDADEMI
jgi:DNA-binding NarL/FixJ family response regulator